MSNELEQAKALLEELDAAQLTDAIEYMRGLIGSQVFREAFQAPKHTSDYEIRKITDITLDDLSLMMQSNRYKWLAHAYDSLDRLDTFGIFDASDTRLGFVVCCTYAASYDAVFILDLQIDENNTKHGYGSMLIKECIEYYEQQGYNEFHANLMTGDDCDTLFLRLGFHEIHTETTMKYAFRSIHNSALGNGLDKLAPIIKKVKTISELDSDAKDFFRDRMLNRADSMDIDKFDPNLTAYFTHKDNVLAFMAFERSGDNNLLMISSYYMSENPDSKLAIPAILAYLTQKQLTKESDAEYITLYFSLPTHVQAMETYFGEPEVKVIAKTYKYFSE